jgi:hypothetical protein
MNLGRANQVDPRRMRTAIEVARADAITTAAETLGLTQIALSLSLSSHRPKTTATAAFEQELIDPHRPSSAMEVMMMVEGRVRVTQSAWYPSRRARRCPDALGGARVEAGAHDQMTAPRGQAHCCTLRSESR